MKISHSSVAPTGAAQAEPTLSVATHPVRITLRTAVCPEGIDLAVPAELGLQIATMLLDYAADNLRTTTVVPFLTPSR